MKKEGGRERGVGADSESLSSSCATSYANRIAFKLIIRTVGVCLHRACVCATCRKGGRLQLPLPVTVTVTTTSACVCVCVYVCWRVCAICKIALPRRS